MSTFDQLLGKLSELVGGERAPTNAMAGARNVAESLEPKVTYRASMLPVGNFDDGSVGMVWPQSAVDAKNAFGRFHRGEAPQPEDAVLAGMAMTGAGAFGLGRSAVSRGSVAGAERAETSSGLPSHSVEAGRLASNPPEAAPTGAVVSGFDQRLNLMRAAIDELNPSLQQTWRGDLDPGRFGVPSPFEFVEGQPYRRAPDSGQQVMVDLAKLKTNQPDVSGYAVKDIAERGPDPSLTPTRAAQSEPTVARLEDGSYLVLGGNHRLSAAALKGETTAPATIFSNPPDAVPAGLLATGGGEHHSRRQPRSQSGQFVTPDSFDGKLHSFNKVLVDLDGDGKPDVAVPVPSPTNAMAAMRGRR
jgi:hypothetical protein